MYVNRKCATNTESEVDWESASHLRVLSLKSVRVVLQVRHAEPSVIIEGRCHHQSVNSR